MRSRGIALLVVVLLASLAVRAGAEPTQPCIVWKTGTDGARPHVHHSPRFSPLGSNQLSFTFDSPDQPWTPEQLTTMQGYLSEMVPALTRILGDPAFSTTINIQQDSTMGDYASGSFSPPDNEIFLWKLRPEILCHELAHAFHDDDVFFIDGFEEGIAHAVEIMVLDELRYFHWDAHHAALGDVYYEALNQPAIQPPGGSFHSSRFLLSLRYTMAGYAWDKVEREHPGFLKAFHESYYGQLITDHELRWSLSKLATLGATIAPTMEGLPFETWVSRQQILGASDPGPGLQVFQYVPFHYAYVFDKYGFGDSVAGAHVEWQVFDGEGVVIDAGSGATNAAGSVPIIPLIRPGEEGRLTVRVRATTSSGVAENSTVFTTALPSGLFGAVVGGARGTVTITPLDSAMAPVVCPLVHGQFAAPSLEGVAGRFHLAYVGEDGGRGERYVTKDASAYLALIESLGPNRSARLTARPNVTRQGSRFVLDRPVAAPARLTLYDVAGRILNVIEVPAGASGADWDGADRSGYLCHNGVVLARLTAPGVDATARVVALR